MKSHSDNSRCVIFQITFCVSCTHFVLTRASCRRGPEIIPTLQMMKSLPGEVKLFAQRHVTDWNCHLCAGPKRDGFYRKRFQFRQSNTGHQSLGMSQRSLSWASSIQFHDSPAVTHHFAARLLTLDRILFLWVSRIFRQLVLGKTLKIFCIMVRAGHQLVQWRWLCRALWGDTDTALAAPQHLLPEVFVVPPAHHSPMHMPVSSQTLSPASSSSLQPVLVPSDQGQWE